MGNYDIPQPGAVPVLRKPCGCILNLCDPESGGRNILTWTGVGEEDTGAGESELNIPRVKLTGQGRMPVVDMSKINANTNMRCFSEPPSDGAEFPKYHVSKHSTNTNEPAVTNPLQNAIYAQVNKSLKSQHKPVTLDNANSKPNYANLDFANSLELYENSKDVLSRVAQLPPTGLKSPQRNFSEPRATPQNCYPYFDNNGPANGSNNLMTQENISEKSLCDSEYLATSVTSELHYSQMTKFGAEQTSAAVTAPYQHDTLAESMESMAIMCESDTKFNTIKQMPKNLNNAKYETCNLGKVYFKGKYIKVCSIK